MPLLLLIKSRDHVDMHFFFKVPKNNTNVRALSITITMATTSYTQFASVTDLEAFIQATDNTIRQCIATDGDVEGLMKKITRDVVSGLIFY